ncbi:hypothetical protein BU17DRAFT_79713 [Hysterangium stoloniferum]|nr:hypothetical protein BU17DRAFT_79713 [Hysterangium stoloniferum]
MELGLDEFICPGSLMKAQNTDFSPCDEEAPFTPLRQRKEETAAVGTLLLLDTDGRQGHLQSSFHLSPHDRPRSGRVQLSPHSHSRSPRLTPSPSPHASPIALPSEPPTSPETMYDASISSAGVPGKSRNIFRYITFWLLSLMRTCGERLLHYLSATIDGSIGR